MSRPLRWPSLHVEGPAFVQGFSDAGDGIFRPDRYRDLLAQVEYEAGWGFGRWCIVREVRIKSFRELERQTWFGEGPLCKYLLE